MIEFENFMLKFSAALELPPPTKEDVTEVMK